MSVFRSTTLNNLQKKIVVDELDVPMLDIYEASLLARDWHYPTDGRHYRPEFNQMTFNWFFSTKSDVVIDNRFQGYGVFTNNVEGKP